MSVWSTNSVSRVRPKKLTPEKYTKEFTPESFHCFSLLFIRPMAHFAPAHIDTATHGAPRPGDDRTPEQWFDHDMGALIYEEALNYCELYEYEHGHALDVMPLRIDGMSTWIKFAMIARAKIQAWAIAIFERTLVRDTWETVPLDLDDEKYKRYEADHPLVQRFMEELYPGTATITPDKFLSMMTATGRWRIRFTDADDVRWTARVSHFWGNGVFRFSVKIE